MSTSISRYYCEPCFGSKEKLNDICQNLTKNDQEYIKLDYNFQYFNPKYQYSISIFQISFVKGRNDFQTSYFRLNHELQKINKKNNLKSLKINELSLPQFYFKLKSLDFIPLQICSSIPILKDHRYIFNFNNEIEKRKILQNFEYFVQKNPFTHFIALPIAPVFPNWLNTFKKVTTDLNLNKFIQSNLIHITLGIFLINNEEELQKVNQIIEETIKEIQWPQSNFLRVSKIDYFSWHETSTVFLKPEDNIFTQCLFNFVKLFLTKMQENGLSYCDASQVLHITFLKNFPNESLDYVLQNFNVSQLPSINVNELRLVQRNNFDEDGFYKTIYRYSINDNIVIETRNDDDKIKHIETESDHKKFFLFAGKTHDNIDDNRKIQIQINNDSKRIQTNRNTSDDNKRIQTNSNMNVGSMRIQINKNPNQHSKIIVSKPKEKSINIEINRKNQHTDI